MTTNKPILSDYDCVDEVPLHRVRGNQLGILISVIVAFVTQQLWILILPLAVQLISRTYGVKYNLFVRLLSPLFPRSTVTESRELLRFNQLLAILFLFFALVGYAAGSMVFSSIFLGFLTLAVILALLGYCPGCFIYFQWKQFRAKRRAS